MSIYKVGQSSFEEIIRDQMSEKYFGREGEVIKIEQAIQATGKYNVQKEAKKKKAKEQSVLI